MIAAAVIPGTSRIVTWTGDSGRLSAIATNSAGDTIPGAILHFDNDRGDILRVSSDGSYEALAPGTARVAVSARYVGTEIVVEVRPALRGMVYLADSVLRPAQARLVLVAGDSTETIGTDAGGAFIVRLDALPREDVELRVLPDDEHWWGAALRVNGARLPLELSTILVPRQWNAGGQRIAISPARIVGEGGFARMSRSPSGERRIVGWPLASRPIPVAFARNTHISATDSAAFWLHARALESVLGATLFRPAERADSGIVVRINTRLGERGLTSITWDALGSIQDAELAVQSRAALTDATVVQHELLHALGAGHVRAWRSIMNAVQGGDAAIVTDDIVAFQVLDRIREAQLRTGARIGLFEAAQYESAAKRE